MTFHILHQVWLPPPQVKIEGKDTDREREERTLLLFCYHFQRSPAMSLISLKCPPVSFFLCLLLPSILALVQQPSHPGSRINRGVLTGHLIDVPRLTLLINRNNDHLEKGRWRRRKLSRCSLQSTRFLQYVPHLVLEKKGYIKAWMEFIACTALSYTEYTTDWQWHWAKIEGQDSSF